MKPRVWVSVLSLVFAIAVSVGTWWHLILWDFMPCSRDHLIRGASIDLAIKVVLFGGLAECLLLLSVGLLPRVRPHPRLLVGASLLAAATLGLAVSLVALDAATYRRGNPATDDCDAWSGTTHVGFLYVLWGVPLAVLLIEALRAGGRPIARAGANSQTLTFRAWMIRTVRLASSPLDGCEEESRIRRRLMMTADLLLGLYLVGWLGIGGYELTRLPNDGIADIVVPTVLVTGLLALAFWRPIAVGGLLLFPGVVPIGLVSAQISVWGYGAQPRGPLTALDLSRASQIALGFGLLTGIPTIAAVLLILCGLSERRLRQGSALRKTNFTSSL